MTYGYGNGISEDHYARMDNAKPLEQRDPFIGEGGPHQLALVSLIEYEHKDKNDPRMSKGMTAKAVFVVESSPVHAAGSRVVKLWFLQKPSKFPSQPTDADRFVAFLCALKGVPQGTPMSQQCRTLLRDRVNDQLARGTRIVAYGRNTSKKIDKPFVEVDWTHVKQDEAAILAMRTKIETTPGLIPADRGGPQAPAAPQAPPQMPGHGGSGMGAYVGPQGYGAPANPYAGQPPAAPAGWGAPQAPAAAPAPHAGFGAQIPPGNGGGQGGGGTGW